MTDSRETPATLLGPGGDPVTGVFTRPLRNVDLDRVRLPYGGLRAPGAWSRFRLKQWQHFLLILPDVALTFAIVDTRFLKVSWCGVITRADGRHREHRREGPWMDVRVARELYDGRTHARARRYRIDVHNDLDGGGHDIAIRIDRDGRLPLIEADLRCLHALDEIEPLVAVLPVGTGRVMYTHKVPLPLRGTVRVGGERHEARPSESFAVLDVHKAHYPRHTWWNWATCAGRDGEGRALGLNLTRNVHTDDHRLNENALWIDGRLQRLGGARFSLDREDLLAPWHLTTTDGRVDLEFRPRGQRAEDTRLGLVRSVFVQPFGTFHGTVLDDAGTAVSLDGLFGVCEDHDALW